MEDNSPESKAQQSKQEAINRGGAFVEMTRSEGWKLVKAYFENKVKALATALLVEDKPIVEYESQRQELIGLRKLLGYIENDIKTLEDESEKNRGVAKK